MIQAGAGRARSESRGNHFIETFVGSKHYLMSQFRAPVLKLYRRILKAHLRKLPFEMKKVGDDYVRAEFRSIRKAKKESQIHTCVGGSDSVDLVVF